MPSNSDIIDIIQLINTENLGPVSFYKLVAEFGSVGKALQALPQFPKYHIFSRSKAEQQISLAKQKGIHIISYQDPLYPQKLKLIKDAPPIIYALGNVELLNHPDTLAIVGARNASISGRKTASKIAYDLTNQNILVVSGMARGIDAAAHKGALYALDQRGPTIAVLGSGVDTPYPAQNIELYNIIKEQGVVISELALGTQPMVSNFPRRNRIISALGNGTLVVEATLQSGSLSTANYARTQNKHVFAIPGSPQDARALGPNKLIKEGAVLVESAQDIINILSLSPAKKLNSTVDKPTKDVAIRQKQQNLKFDENKPAKSQEILDFITTAGVHIDELVRATGLDSATLSLKLLELELNSEIERQPGNIIALIRKTK